MPSRWWVPVPGVDPDRVKLEFVHAAVSRWFDRSAAEHAAGEKPYAVSPLAADERGGPPGLEIAVFTDVAERRLLAATGEGSGIRLGNQIRATGRATRMMSATWDELAAGPHEQAWELTFATPVTFRSGNRATPLPEVGTILFGLARAWTAWSDLQLPPPHLAIDKTYVSDLELTSTTLRIAIPKRSGDGGRVEIAVPGSLGMLRLRCSDPHAAATAAPLLRFAAYAGVGSMTRRGLGVTRLRTIRP